MVHFFPLDVVTTAVAGAEATDTVRTIITNVAKAVNTFFKTPPQVVLRLISILLIQINCYCLEKSCLQASWTTKGFPANFAANLSLNI